MTQSYHFGSEAERMPFRANADAFKREYAEERAKKIREKKWSDEQEQRYLYICDGLQAGDVGYTSPNTNFNIIERNCATPKCIHHVTNTQSSYCDFCLDVWADCEQIEE